MGVKHEVFWREAVYLGVAGYGTDQARDRDRLRHRFFLKSRDQVCRIANPDGSYPVQNQLMEGAHCRLLVRGDMVLAAEEHSPVAQGRLMALAPGHPN